MSNKFTNVKVKDFDAENLSFSNFSKNERSSQPISYCNYDNNGNLILQTDWISMDHYGIPKKDDKYYTDDDKRSFIKIPLIEGLDASDLLREKMESLDEILESDKMKNKLLVQKDKDGKLPSQKDIEKILKKTIYESIVREPQSDPNYNGPNVERPKYMKSKFKINYKTKEIDTKIFRVNTKMCDDGKDFEICLNENNIPVREDLSDKVKTVTDLEDLKILYKSKCRFLLLLSKLWNASGKYGATWKIHKMEIAPRPRTSAGVECNADFNDETESNTLRVNKPKPKVESKNLDGDSGSDPDPESDSESESEPEPEPEPDSEPETKSKKSKSRSKK